ncbi:hypothetical protein B0H13DRAFT_2345511 [Mycena leptocephala]|nr:hypothetical protein B0H13DRAFT_2345511 [Mycena leptocephala]
MAGRLTALIPASCPSAAVSSAPFTHPTRSVVHASESVESGQRVFGRAAAPNEVGQVHATAAVWGHAEAVLELRGEHGPKFRNLALWAP